MDVFVDNISIACTPGDRVRFVSDPVFDAGSTYFDSDSGRSIGIPNELIVIAPLTFERFKHGLHPVKFR